MGGLLNQVRLYSQSCIKRPLFWKEWEALRPGDSLIQEGGLLNQVRLYSQSCIKRPLFWKAWDALRPGDSLIQEGGLLNQVRLYSQSCIKRPLFWKAWEALRPGDSLIQEGGLFKQVRLYSQFCIKRPLFWKAREALRPGDSLIQEATMATSILSNAFHKRNWLTYILIFVLVQTLAFMMLANNTIPCTTPRFAIASPEREHGGPLKRQNPPSTMHKASLPSIVHETARRKLETTSEEFWFYIRNELQSLRQNSALQQGGVQSKVESILKTSNEYQRTLQNDFLALKYVDNSEEWRLNQSLTLGRLVQNRLRFLQNPKQCSSARKLVCTTKICGTGLGCKLHHYAMCLIIAYATERTMVVESNDTLFNHFQPLSETCTDRSGNASAPWREGVDDVQVVTIEVDRLQYRPSYLPLAVPDDLADRLEHFHGNPATWWIGQFLAYIFRPSQTALSSFDSGKLVDRPYVGVHVRRTDKLAREAQSHQIDEYMSHVNDWFDARSLRTAEAKRNVFLATDSSDVISEMINRYPQYSIFGNTTISEKANPHFRNSDISLLGVIHDIYYLSRSDFIVCTFSSNVCRLAYALMQTRNGDASKQFKSLDDVFYMDGQHPHLLDVIEPIEGQFSLNVGDKVQILGNHWDGFSKIVNINKPGLVPSYKLMDKVVRVKMPTYPNVDDNTVWQRPSV